MLVRIAADTAQMRSEMKSAQNAVGGAVAGIKNTVLQLAAVVGGFNLAEKFVETADAVTLMDSRLKLAVGGGADFAKAQKDIYDISQRSNVGIQETTALYTKLYEPVKRLGGGVKENTAIVEAFAASLKIGGANTQEAASATLQFAQAMGSGKLNGDEFRAIAEASPRFMKALADGMGVPIENLKKMGSEGKLTADVVGNALMKSLGQLRSEMGTIPDTFGGAAQRFKNDVTLAIGELNAAAGTTLGLAGAVEEARKLIPAVKDELAGAFQAVAEWIERNREGLGQAWAIAKDFMADVWEMAKAFGRVVGFVGEWLVQSGTLKTTMEVLRLLVAGLGDGIDIVAAVFTKAGAILLDFVGIFSDSAKAAAQAAHAAADATFKRFGEGKTQVGALNEELQRNAQRTAQAKEALAGAGVSAGDMANEVRRLQNQTAGQSQALVTLRNKNAEATEEQKKAADAVRKATEAGRSYDESLSKQIGSLQRAITVGRELTEAEKEQEKLTELLRSGKVKMTEAEVLGTRAKIDHIAQLKEQIAQTKAYEKSVKDAEDEVYKARVRAGEEAQKQAASIKALAEKAREENTAMSMTREQLDQLELSRLRDQRATMAEIVAREELLGYCSAETEAHKETLAALNELIDAREQGVHLKAAKEAAEEWKKTSDSIADGLTDALMRGFESGKSLWLTFRDTLTNAFKTMVLQPTIKAIMAPVSGALGSLFSGNAMAGTGGGGGGLGSLLSSGMNLLNGSTISGGIGSAWTNFATSGLGQNLGLSSLQNIGGNMIAVQTGMSSMIGSGLGMLGNGFAGYGISSALSGNYSAGSWVNTVAGLASAIPGIGPIAGVVGGLVNRAFGRKPKEMKDSGIEGAISGGDATGRQYQDWFQKGGWFRSNKSGTDYSALSEDLGAALDLGAKGVLEQTKAWAEALRLPAESLANVTTQFKVKLTENEQQNQQAITDLLASYQTDLSEQFQLILEPFEKAGEGLAQTMQRLATLSNFSENINELGGIFSKIAGSSIEARENIIALAGGIDELMASAGKFVQDYYTREEQAGLQAKSVLETLASLNIDASAIGSREDFRRLLESIDVTTKQGQEQVVALLQIAPQFATLADYAKDQNLTLEEIAKQAPVVDILDQMLPEQKTTNDAISSTTDAIKEGNLTLTEIVAAVKEGNLSISTGLQAIASAQSAAAASAAAAVAAAQAAATVAATAAANVSLFSSSPSYTVDIGTP
jgi:tape measure domain-containing protein